MKQTILYLLLLFLSGSVCAQCNSKAYNRIISEAKGYRQTGNYYKAEYYYQIAEIAACDAEQKSFCKKAIDSLLAEKRGKKLGSPYFYRDSFALEHKQVLGKTKYGFIDKNGKIKIDYDFDFALPFDKETGFAKVKIQDKDYLLDTKGNTYRVAYSLEQLSKDIIALDLQGVRLKEFPAAILSHPQLRVLILRGVSWGKSNRLTLPENIDLMTNLEYLNVDFCRLKSLPANLNKLQKLTWLSLEQNQINNIEQVKDLKNLTHFNCGANEDIVDLEPIKNLKNLRELTFWGTQINSLEPIKNLKNLTHLNFEVNTISDLNPIKDLKDLKDLNLGSNNVSDLSPIKDLKKLIKLNFEYNDVSDLDPIKNLTNLTELYFEDNQIFDLEAIKALKKLIKLNLDWNEIDSLPDATFWGNITELNLRQKKLSVLPQGFEKLKNLTVLDLSMNRLSDITPVKDLTNLTELDFGSNKITDLEPIKGLINLTKLDFEYNEVSDLSPIIGLEKLTTLKFVNNNIRDISPIKDLAELTILDFDWNKIDSVPDALIWEKTTRLDLNKKELYKLPKGLEKIRNLTILDLGANKLTDLSPIKNL